MAASAGSMALYMQGILYESATNSNPDKAVAAYLNALKLNPKNKRALSSLVNLLSRQKRFEEAFSVLKKISEQLTGKHRAANICCSNCGLSEKT